MHTLKRTSSKRSRGAWVTLAFLGILAVYGLTHRAQVKALKYTLSPANFFGKKAPETAGGWQKLAENPVLGGDLGTCFDICVVKEADQFRMYFSWRPKKSIASVTSTDGIHWSAPETALDANPSSGWETDVNRPSVVKQGNKYLMWYTGQGSGAKIGYAESTDGIHFQRVGSKPLIIPDQGWEKKAVMCPDVTYDAPSKTYKMWYSGGGEDEPDAIGYATSKDGITWKKLAANPMFTPDKTHAWEQFKVTACHVAQVDGKYLMFYIGFFDLRTAAIGLARSTDGITNWERLPANPIVSRGPLPREWDHDAVYKPFVLPDGKGNWLLWYNGRRDGTEQIGVATHPGLNLWPN